MGEEQFAEIKVVLPWSLEKCKKCQQFGHYFKAEGNGTEGPLEGEKHEGVDKSMQEGSPIVNADERKKDPTYSR